MRIDFEERIVRNPVLGAVMLWSFVFQHEQRESAPEPPNIPMLMPVLPIVLHQASTAKLKGMRFDSGLAKAILDTPTMRAGLQERIIAFAPLTLSSLNIACAAGLLRRSTRTSQIAFQTAVSRLPTEIAPEGVVRDMANAAKRLGAFFADESVVQLQMELGIRL
ncbi:three component ABC system middle component [Azospirillum baldaniorum]|uniref:three component ABC system middle component n=1 Tax=Azospirillum baldaniorum TaxID=1064539 RepID=UPI0031F2D803